MLNTDSSNMLSTDSSNMLCTDSSNMLSTDSSNMLLYLAHNRTTVTTLQIQPFNCQNTKWSYVLITVLDHQYIITGTAVINYYKVIKI